MPQSSSPPRTPSAPSPATQHSAVLRPVGRDTEPPHTQPSSPPTPPAPDGPAEPPPGDLPRSLSRGPTSGPGRGPSSDGRSAHRRVQRVHGRRRPGRRRARAEAELTRQRAIHLFDERRDHTAAADASILPRWDGPPVPRWAVDQDTAEDRAHRTREPGSAAPTSRTTVVRHRGTAADEGVRGSSSSAATSLLPGEADADFTWPSAQAPDASAMDGEHPELLEHPGHPERRGRHGRHERHERHEQLEHPEQHDRRERRLSAVRERLPLWLQSRCGLERRSVVVLAVLLAAGAALAVQHFWLGRPQSVGAPDVVRAAPAAPAAPAGADLDATGGPEGGLPVPTASAAMLVVDIGGKVREPGVHRLPMGSRVADALRAAGGAKPGTDLSGLNRARLLVDGEHVVVGAPPGAQGAAAGPGAVPGATAPGARVSLNSATAEQLDTLPGVGPVLARHIIDYRTQHSGFRSVDELREVNGIGERRFAELKDAVRL